MSAAATQPWSRWNQRPASCQLLHRKIPRISQLSQAGRCGDSGGIHSRPGGSTVGCPQAIASETDLMPAAPDLIATYRNPGLCQLADVIVDFYGRRSDLHRRGASFGGEQEHTGQKISTDISLVAIDRSDAEAHGLAQTILRAVNAALQQYLKERPLFLEVCPQQGLFVPPLFNIQHYAPGEGFKAWHCDWSTETDATEPNNRVLAWILYCNDVNNGGTEFHWQQHHVEAVRGQLALFPAGMSHVHRGRVSHSASKTITTGWINAGTLEAYLERLREPPSTPWSS